MSGVEVEVEVVDIVDLVRRRPGMYVGDIPQGLLTLAMALVGNAFDQHLLGRCGRIEIEVNADGCLTVTDDGPGMSGDAAAIVTRFGRMFDRPTEDGHRPHVHLTEGAFSLVVACALAESLELVTVRAGEELRAAWSRGRLRTAPETHGTAAPSGTRLRLRPDPEIFGDHRIDLGALLEQIDMLVALRPGLVIDCRLARRYHEPEGLAAWVRRVVDEPTVAVAIARRDVVTSDGPITVDVALAWRGSHHGPSIASYVNYLRSREHGTHVDGLYDGIRRVFRGKRAAHEAGLVAAVAVVLADVHWGNPTKDRLVTPAVRAPVADVTAVALEAWAAAHPDAAAALRARLSGR